MGYLHIDNLYKPEAQAVLAFRRCYALEKIHGTSAHVRWDGVAMALSPGGVKLAELESYFDGTLGPALDSVRERIAEKFGSTPIVVYGEAYGGKCQGMRKTYGERLRFVAFEVKVGPAWLSVPQAEDVARGLGLEFVHHEEGPTDLDWLDAQRDKPSTQAVRNGIAEARITEGIVIRPPFEVVLNSGARVMAKHKRPEFRERKSIPVVDPTQREMLTQAEAIADEWVTDMRLSHVLDKLGNPASMADTGRVIHAMVEDVCREASGEIVDSKAARKAIGAAAARLYKRRITTIAGPAPVSP